MMMSLFAEMITAQASNKYSATVQEPNGNYVWIDTRYTADHGWETMVFKCDAEGNVSDWNELDCDRYSNEEEARAGHQQMVSRWGINVEKKENKDTGTYVYEVVHYYDTDGGFGDAIPQEDVIAVFSTKAKADECVAKYANPHVYDRPYMSLECGSLEVREREIDVMPDESEMWWKKEEKS